MNWSCDLRDNERPQNKIHQAWTSDKQTNGQTDKHVDSMTDPAQRAESVKNLVTYKIFTTVKVYGYVVLFQYGPEHSFKTEEETNN